MQLVLDTHEITLRVRNRSFHVSAGEETRLISPHRLTSIAVLSRCTLTSAAILLAVEHQIPLLFFDETGDATARLWSVRFGSLAELRRAQVLFATADAATIWAAELFKLKADGQSANLLFFSEKNFSKNKFEKPLSEIEKLAKKLLPSGGLDNADPDFFNKIMVVEAPIAKIYWQCLAEAVPPSFEFPKRSRRPAQDMFNAALNYLYGMMYHTVEQAALAAGLDPMLGIIHADQHGEPTLVFDLIEPFRPAVDRLLVQMLHDSRLDNRHFEFKTEADGGGVWVEREGRKLLIAAFNDFLAAPAQFRGEEAPLRQHIFGFAGDFAEQLKKFWENDPAGQLRHRKRPTSTPDSE